MVMAKCGPKRPAAAQVPAIDETETMQLPVDPRRLIGKRQVMPVKKINPRPGVSRPSVASQAGTGKISSLRQHGDLPDTLRDAEEGCLATAGGGDCRPRRKQETSWQREGRSFVAAGLKATSHLNRSEEFLKCFQNF